MKGWQDDVWRPMAASHHPVESQDDVRQQPFLLFLTCCVGDDTFRFVFLFFYPCIILDGWYCMCVFTYVWKLLSASASRQISSVSHHKGNQVFSSSTTISFIAAEVCAVVCLFSVCTCKRLCALITLVASYTVHDELSGITAKHNYTKYC